MNMWSLMLMQVAHPARRPPRTYIAAVEKLCLSCGHVRQPEDFHKRLLSRDGLQNYCKACQSLRWRIRVQKDPIKREALMKQLEALRA